MLHDSQERLVALAGIYQAVTSVIRIAREGVADPQTMEPSVHSLFQIDAASAESVFGPPGAVMPGVRQVITQLTGQPERKLETTRYVVMLMRLERNLSRRPDLLARIGEGIQAAEIKRVHFDLLHPNLFAHFAALYSDTLSQLEPRIIIRGESLHLRNTDNQNRIRTLLLTGVRAARLWRQVGGSRWQIVLRNRQLLVDARQYLDVCAV